MGMAEKSCTGRAARAVADCGPTGRGEGFTEMPHFYSPLSRSPQAQSLQFLLQPLAEPLLDHALIVQIPRPCDALEAGEQARVEAQRDGGALAVVRAEQRLIHQPGLDACLHPEGGFLFLRFKAGHVAPCGDRFHASA